MSKIERKVREREREGQESGSFPGVSLGKRIREIYSSSSYKSNMPHAFCLVLFFASRVLVSLQEGVSVGPSSGPFVGGSHTT